MNTKRIILTAVAAAVTAAALAGPRVIAHRGFWRTEGAAENSIAALRAAAVAGVYGSEFDVQMTADSVLVVNHDDSIQGRDIATTPLATLRQLRLANGEPMPTLAEYLAEGKRHPAIKMILEIKPRRRGEGEAEVTRRTVALVRSLGMKRQVEYISFSMHVCELLASLEPKAVVEYLGSDIAPSELLAKGIRAIDYYYKAFEMKPEWVAEAHRLGMAVNVWTVDDEAIMRRMSELGVDYITTNEPLTAKAVSNECK